MTHVYQMTEEDLQRNINKALGVVVDSLRIEGYLTEEQASHIHTNYSLIIETKAWLPEFLANWLKMKDDSMKLRLVKAVGRKAGDDK